MVFQTHRMYASRLNPVVLDWHICTVKCQIASWWEAAVSCREISSVICDDLRQRHMGVRGTPKKEGTIYLPMADSLQCAAELAQH